MKYMKANVIFEFFVRRFLLVLVFSCALTLSAARAQTLAQTTHEVLFETTKGKIRIALYDDTPIHRDNFIKLVKEGFYDGLLFHRVIYNFMIQTGDTASRHARPGELLGSSAEGYKLPAEILYPKLYHKRGVVAAARESDDVNPERNSSASQFYIVYGKRFNDVMLDDVQVRLDKQTGGRVKLTPDVRETYKSVGGTPHLDGQYTVFGEVVEGLDVVKDIEWGDTDENARPKEDVRIIRAVVVK